jgi:C-terminal processing protease CtpA/Prc
MRRMTLLFALLFPVALFAHDPKQLATDATAALLSKDYPKSIALFREAIAAGKDDSTTIYNFACALALGGNKEQALATLEKLVARGYANADQLLGDTDLVSLRDEARFKAVIEKAKANAAIEKKKWDNPVIATPYRPALSDEEKIAGVSRVWSEVKYNFANFDLIPDVDWDALYMAYLPKARAAKDTREYYAVLTEFVARLRDGHTGAYPPRELSDAFDGYPAMRQQWFEGRVVVVKVGDELKDVVHVGDEIVAVDGATVADFAKAKVMPYISASTQQDLENRAGLRLLTGAAGTKVEITLRDAAGKTRNVTVERQPAAKRIPLITEYFEMEMLPGGVAYLKLNAFDNDTAANEFEKHFDELSKAKALILDVRRNGGGNSSVGNRILSMLISAPVATTLSQTIAYRPTSRARRGPQQPEFDQSMVNPDAKGRLYKGPVAVLIGPATFSAAEDFAVAFKAAKRGKFYGTATGGSTGQPMFVALPGGGSFRVCTKRDRFADGTEFVGIGIKPDVEVRTTIDDVRAGRDPVVARAVADLAKN